MGLAVVGFCLPQSLLAAPPGQMPAAVDVTLGEGGVLAGQVVDPQGSALAGASVSLWERNRQVAATTTDRNGCFSVSGLHGGVYHVAAAGRHGLYRLWNPGMAPPSSRQGTLLVAPGQTVRGKDCGLGNLGLPRGGALCFWLSHPCVLAGIAAAAIATPIIIHNTDKPPASP
ncbi:MAG: hypothetical protein A2V70_18425 [Planctomycetes bacterium RBG_13_63_9]|nr:MAG: hypothetical protein A2V70_18425 [Planctomycetes bacterium RBG_13_63_9]